MLPKKNIIILLGLVSIYTLGLNAADPALERSQSSSSISEKIIQKTGTAPTGKTLCQLAVEADTFVWSDPAKEQPILCSTSKSTGSYSSSSTASSSSSSESSSSESSKEKKAISILQNAQFIQCRGGTEIVAPKPTLPLGIHRVPQATPVPSSGTRMMNNFNSATVIHNNGWDQPVRHQPRAMIETDDDETLCGTKCCLTCCDACCNMCINVDDEILCGTKCCFTCCSACCEGCSKICKPSCKCCCAWTGGILLSPCILAAAGCVIALSPCWGPVACCIYGCKK